MNIKTIFLTSVIAIFIIASFFVGKSCNKPEPVKPDETQIKVLDNHIAELEDSNKTLNELATTLQASVKAKDEEISILKAQTAHSVSQIDSTIKNDSLQALPKYRIALNGLGVETVSGPITLFELGWGAKFLTELPGCRLQNKIYEEEKIDYENVISYKNKIIANTEDQYKSQVSLTGIMEKSKDYYKDLYENTQRFLYHRFAVYAGAGVSYAADLKIQPSLQIGVGVLIWRND